jgi:hypothetical protein
MQFLLDEMQAKLDQFRAELAAAQGNPPEVRLARNGRRNSAASYWAGKTEEEKAEEYQRRNAKRMATLAARGINSRGKKLAAPLEMVPAKMHPRDPRHPGHEAWIHKLKSARAENQARKAK